ncbi:MAG: methylenetetrahydrofolate reductase [NAD(P)H] [Bacteriovoracaceae bacterium]|jgi:methylenetetrahydrofolate reductase (NADPH)|nr:methylenetetrahydrofolate reductase [NAD(P)H] [Bacteriovoracaceae bacterium]
MHIKTILEQNTPSISFEFFPPKTKTSSEALFKNIQDLIPLGPSFVSVTYGAGGSTRDLTQNLLIKLKEQTNLEVVSHLTCVGSTKEETKQILQSYDSAGIHNIMALRGDPAKGQKSFTPTPGGFEYAGSLVSFIKEHFPHMGIGVAGFPEGHPECPNRMLEMEYLKEKVDLGADYICTQLFFENRDFYDFRERCEVAGIKVPIIAGLMPITTLKSMKRMSELALGARFPAKLMKAMARAHDDEYAEKVGIHWATEQVFDLIDNGTKGIHFYTLNKSKATKNIYGSLGIKHSSGLSEDHSDKFMSI